jgi:hypothetical protein
MPSNDCTLITGYAATAVRPCVSEVESHSTTVRPFDLRKLSMSALAARGGK